MLQTGDDCELCVVRHGITGTILEGYTETMSGLEKDTRTWPGKAVNIICSKCYREQCNFCKKMVDCDSCMGGCDANTCDSCMKSWADDCTSGKTVMFRVYGDHNQCYNCGMRQFGDGKTICKSLNGR